MTGLLLRHGVTAGAQAVLRAYVKAEAELEAGPWQPYAHILAEVARRIAVGFGVTLSASEAELLAAGLCDWPPFADTPAALARLASRYRLIILSNIDDAFFAGTAAHLGVTFTEVITAEQLRSYKRGRTHFQAARSRVGSGRLLHVAQSLYHDHVPARALAVDSVHIDRPSLLCGTGIAPPVTLEPPPPRLPDLKSLADALSV